MQNKQLFDGFHPVRTKESRKFFSGKYVFTYIVCSSTANQKKTHNENPPKHFRGMTCMYIFCLMLNKEVWGAGSREHANFKAVKNTIIIKHFSHAAFFKSCSFFFFNSGLPFLLVICSSH